MTKKSAGILAFRKKSTLEVFLVHPGGPFWKNKDNQSWSIPKGEFTDENPLEAAQREFQEETGITVNGVFFELSPIRQKGGKEVYAWAIETNFITTGLKSNLFEMQWPPRSGNTVQFPEVDKFEWFTIVEARKKILVAQSGFLDHLELYLAH